eukprot:700341_1
MSDDSDDESDDESDDYDTTVIVMVNGSGVHSGMQLGFAGDDAPRSVFPPIIGRPRHERVMCGIPSPSYIGDAAFAHKSILDITCPIHRGIVTNFDDMERIWSHSFYHELRIEPSERSCLLSERVHNPLINTERTMQCMFEKLNVTGFRMEYQTVLSYMASGRGTATVLHIGDGVTTVTSIKQAVVVKNSIQRLDFGGTDLNQYLMNLLSISNPNIDFGRNYYLTADDIRRKLCYVAQDYETEVQKSSHDIAKSYELPDGSSLTIGKERFAVGEALFTKGIHQILYKSLMKLDINLRQDMFTNILLSGGTTLLDGFAPRIELEISNLIQKDRDKTIVKVIAPPERRYSAWIGGSILASLSTYNFVSKTEYNEAGLSMLYRKHVMLTTSNNDTSTGIDNALISIYKDKQGLLLLDGYLRMMQYFFSDDIKELIWVYIGTNYLYKYDELSVLMNANKELITALNTDQNECALLESTIGSGIHADEFKEVDIKSIKILKDECVSKQAILKQKIAKLQQKNELLRDQCHRIRIKTDAVAMRRNTDDIHLDVSKYRTWSQDDVLHWILGLESGKYIQYDNLLIEAFKEMLVNGQDLESIEKADIEAWGIKHFKDRTSLFWHIQKLRSDRK